MSLKLGHLNIRSLSANLINFKDEFLNSPFDVIALTETWLTNEVNVDNYRLTGYNFFFKNRIGRGGGVALFVKNSFKCIILDVQVRELEQLWLSLSVGGTKYAIGVIYKPPCYNVNSFLIEFEDVVNILSSQYNHVIITGDFNINMLQVDRPEVNRFYNILESYDLMQIINKPTHYSQKGCTLIDLIICSTSLNIIDSSVSEAPFIADHCLISCSTGNVVSAKEPIFRTFRDFKNFNYSNFLDDLNTTPFWQIYEIIDIDDKVNFFSREILNLFDVHAPLKTVRITKKKAPWLTDVIKIMMKFKDRALLRYKKSKNPAHWDYYKHLRNHLKTAISNEKKAYLNFTLRNKNNNDKWKCFRDMNIYNKSTTFDLPSDLGNANDINEYFISSSQTINEADEETLSYLTDNVKFNAPQFNFSPVSEELVHKTLLSVTSKSIGSDIISITMLLYCCPIILPYLTHIINFCILSNVFPSSWKLAHVLPLPKINNPSELKDLRPISILPVLSKILEKILNSQIKTYLKNFDLLPQNQSGFRTNHSCVTALLKVMDDILLEADKDKLTILVLLDYSKAFDRISHDLLLAMLHYLGFSNNAAALMKNYLTNRQQKVKIGTIYSDSLDVISGVPQGSILGPLLFTLYTSDFKNSLQYCCSHFYADDTQIYYSFEKSNCHDASAKVNQDLQALISISEKFCLSVNPAKSKVMLLGRKASCAANAGTINICINDHGLQLSNVSKNLGLYVDASFKFSEHVTHIVKNAFSKIKLIYNSRNLLSVKNKTMLCESLVLSNLNYADVVYGPFLNVYEKTRLQRIQNTCIRLIFGLRKYDHISLKFRELNWLNMQQRRDLHICCLIHKILKVESPAYLLNKIKFRTDIHNVNVRQKDLLTIPTHKTSLFQCSFSYCAPKYYNKIPNELKILSLNKFKEKLKAMLVKDLIRFH